MENKYKKKKEDIRLQIFKKIGVYRKTRGILFFDKNSQKTRIEICSLDDNEIEVVLIKLSRNKEILVTTKSIFIIDIDNCLKIKGDEIEDFDYTNWTNLENDLKKASKFKKMYLLYKIRRRIGFYKIIKKDGESIILKFNRYHLADCINECIKKIQFATQKYEAI